MKTEELDNLNLSMLLRIERDLFNCIHQTLIDIVQQKIGLSSFVWDWFDVVEGKQTSLESSAWEYCDRCTEWSPRLLRSVNCCRKLQRTNEFSFLHNHTDSQKIWLYLGFFCPKEYLYCDFYIIFLFCIFRGSFYFPDCLAKLNIDKVYYYNFNKLSKIFEECFKL